MPHSTMGLQDLKPEDADRVIVPVEHAKSGTEKYIASRASLQPLFVNKPKGKQPWIVQKVLEYKLRNLFSGVRALYPPVACTTSRQSPAAAALLFLLPSLTLSVYSMCMDAWMLPYAVVHVRFNTC